MSFADLVLGHKSSSGKKKEQLSVFTGVPVLGLDALSSIGYGPEAALAILTLAGSEGLRQFPIIVFAIVAELAMLSVSYRQTIAAYPRGGGAYVVAKENISRQAGLWAAAALLFDYLLNVAVGISAGAGIVVSGVPALHSHKLAVCLVVLATLTYLNLRGVRQSGLVLVGPVVMFIVFMVVVIALGLVRVWSGGGHPVSVLAPAPLPPSSISNVTIWLLLAAFANGCTAMTGIEVVSNSVPLFRPPREPKGERTLAILTLTLAACLLGIAYLCPAYGIGAMNEQQPAYKPVLSQLILAVLGKGIFSYFALASIFIVLTYSAQSSFAGFPRVCRMLANDGFLPPIFTKPSRHLLPWQGIAVLAVLASVLLVAFGGQTRALIGLFAVGAFTAFVLDQFGMARYWLRRGERARGLFNSAAAAATAIALCIIVVMKFGEGAWMAAAAIPTAVLLLTRLHRR